MRSENNPDGQEPVEEFKLMKTSAEATPQRSHDPLDFSQYMPEGFRAPANSQDGSSAGSGGWIMVLIGALIAFFPLLAAAGGNHDAMWLMMGTLPVGGIVALIGLIAVATSSKKR